MSFYTNEHLLLQQSVRQFAESKILPELSRWEEESYFPDDLFQHLGADGFLGVLIEEQHGGVGGNYLLAGAWCEEFGRIPSVGLTVAVNMHSLVVLPAIQRFASASVKERWLKPGVQGNIIGAYAFTEPGAGSDLTQINTRALRDGNNFILNGSKIFITNGARADVVLVLARTGNANNYADFTTFVVDTSLPGFQVQRTLDKIGWHCSDTAELTFTDMKIPAECVLGEIGKGWSQAMQSLEWERLMLSLTSIGGASACLELTFGYTSERKIFNKRVCDFDVNRTKLTAYWAQLEAARAQAHSCLSLLQAGKRCRREVSLAKLNACELAIKIADYCLQMHGGYGYTTEFLPERWLRDLRLNTIGGGTSQVMSRIAAKEILGDSAQEF